MQGSSIGKLQPFYNASATRLSLILHRLKTRDSTGFRTGYHRRLELTSVGAYQLLFNSHLTSCTNIPTTGPYYRPLLQVGGSGEAAVERSRRVYCAGFSYRLLGKLNSCRLRNGRDEALGAEG